MRGYRTQACVVLVTLFLAGCATLPPAQPARDIKSIAGKWECTLTGSSAARRTSTTTIGEDGKAETIIPGATNPGPLFVGSYRMEAGKFRWKSDTTGRTGTATLHQGDGRRVLVHEVDGASGFSECVPGK
jgi:hypothetical protein